MKVRFFWAAHPLQVLAETWLLGMVLLLGLSALAPYGGAPVLNVGAFFLCGACGTWAVLRARVPAGRPRRQLVEEGVTALLLSLLMTAGLYLPAHLLGWDVLWRETSWDSTALGLVTALTGVGFFLCRLGVRLWLAWDRLRRRRIVWALTHAHLMVAVLVALLGALVVFIASPYRQTAPSLSFGDTLAGVATFFLVTVFPGVVLFIILTAIGLAIVLPPSALFSYLVARRTTRRLEELAAAAQKLRAGDYGARVTVAGEDEVGRLQEDFNAMAGRLEQTLQEVQRQRDAVAHLLQSRRDLMASVSHELRTPVATMRALIESSRNSSENESPSWRHDLEVLENEALRLQGLIDDLFTLAQAETGGLELACVPLDVGPVLTRRVEAMAPLAWSSGRVQVVAEVSSELPPAHADPARLEQVLSNLVRNAVRHTPPGGIVALGAAAEGEWLRLEVRDTGEGISADDLPHIWERFYRGASPLARQSAGAGLGLALVKEMVEAMGGSVGATSVVGQGSCFTVRLPRA